MAVVLACRLVHLLELMSPVSGMVAITVPRSCKIVCFKLNRGVPQSLQSLQGYVLGGPTWKVLG